MRKGIVIAALVVGFAGTAFAADKVASSFVDNSSVGGGSAGFTNGVSTNSIYSTGSSKSASCKIKVQFKGVTGLTDGQALICLPGADVKSPLLPAGGTGNSVVMTVVYSSLTGKAQGKADLRRPVLGCGSQDAVSFNGEMDCYLPDPTYVANAGTTCSGAGGVWIPNPEPGIDNFIGICQHLTVFGFRIPPPSSSLLAVQGSTNPLN